MVFSGACKAVGREWDFPGARYPGDGDACGICAVPCEGIDGAFEESSGDEVVEAGDNDGDVDISGDEPGADFGWHEAPWAGMFGDWLLFVEQFEEFGVVLSFAKAINEEFHGVDGFHFVEGAAEQPRKSEFFFVEQKLFSAGG